MSNIRKNTLSKKAIDDLVDLIGDTEPVSNNELNNKHNIRPVIHITNINIQNEPSFTVRRRFVPYEKLSVIDKIKYNFGYFDKKR